MNSVTGTDLVSYTRYEGIGILIIAAGGANALTPDVRRGLMTGLRAAGRDPGLEGLVLMGTADAGFSAGLDLAELGDPVPTAPPVSDLALAIERMPVPVIAALSGRALGAGAELALAAHWRLATESTLIGLPEISLGVVPGAGATQRLPRLAGAEVALGMLLTGKSAPVQLARRVGLIDGVVDGDLRSGAVRFAQGLAGSGTAPRPTSERRHYLTDGAAFLSAVEAKRVAPGRLAAAHRIVDCVEAALLLPFVQGLEMEAIAHRESLAHPEARGLRHAYFAERRCPPTLLKRDGRSFVPTDAGAARVARLMQALRTAAERTEAAGWSAAAVDAALRAYGFARGVLMPEETEGPVRADTGVVRRVVAAVLAEGARMVEAGDVPRPSDADALAIHGLGWPRLTGGPMLSGEILGLDGLRREMEGWAAESPLWQPPGLVARAAGLAGGFAALTA